MKLVSKIYSKNKNNFIGRSMRFVKYRILSRGKNQFSGTKGDLRYIPSGKGVFKNTKRIAIELSNICNYATIHPKCPLFKTKEPKILSEDIVYHILETCKKYDYKGYITYDVYNEPGIDPRLMMFFQKTKKMLPKAKLILQSNGFYFTQSLAEEYVKNGVDVIRISAYSPQFYERYSKIKLDIPYHVTLIEMDDRMGIYDKPEQNCAKPCLAPLNEVIVTCEGKISLCCVDWKRHHNFGDLNKQSLEEILQSKEINEAYKRLSTGDRYLNLCKRCTGAR